MPQKALIWEDENGTVWFAYNDPQYLKRRHEVSGCDEAFGKIAKALGNFAKTATNQEKKGTVGSKAPHRPVYKKKIFDSRFRVPRQLIPLF